MTTQTMKLWLQEIVNLRDDIAHINSPEFRATCDKSNPYPGMLGALEGRIFRPTVSAQIMLEHIGDIERLERIANVFENIDVDLDDSALSVLELMCKRTWTTGPHVRETSQYRSERNALADAINKAISEVQESERELEHESAVESIGALGFVRFEDDSFDGWVRDGERIVIEMAYKHHITTYSWELAKDGVTADSGKSGEFRRLIALIAPKAVTA